MLEILEADVGRFRRQLGLGETDDKIMMLEGPLIPQADKPGAPGAQTAYEKFLVGGPHFWVGPFLLLTSQESPYTVHIPISKMRSDYDYRKFGNWVVDNIARLSKKKMKQVAAMQRNVSLSIKKDGKTWGYMGYGTSFYPHVAEKPNRCSIPGGVCVPDDQIWWRNYLKGKDPIAKFDHPTRKRSGGGAEKWGVFVAFEEAVTGKSWDYSPSRPDGNHPEWMAVTFKKVDPGFWGSLWDWLVTIVTKLVETVVDLIKSILSGIMHYACSQAKPILREMEAAAQKKAEVSLSADVIAKTGVSNAQLNAAIKAGSSGSIVSAGESIIRGLCGAETPTKPPVDEKPPESELRTTLAVAGGSAALVALIRGLILKA